MKADPPPELFAFHAARSRFIDAFSETELATVRLLERIGLPRLHLFGQNIEALKRVKASPTLAKTMHKRLNDQLDVLTAIQPMRCDIVHGTMKIATIDGRKLFCFANAQQESSRGLQARIIAPEQLEDAIVELTTTRQELDKINRPSSPPQPSPAAAGDP